MQNDMNQDAQAEKITDIQVFLTRSNDTSARLSWHHVNL